jgi:hypothetical protein
MEDVDWIHLAQDRGQLPGFFDQANGVMVPEIRTKLLLKIIYIEKETYPSQQNNSQNLIHINYVYRVY